MENRDILFQVGFRLDNKTLSKLLYPQLWDSIKSLLSDERFWYKRCEHFVNRSLLQRTKTDWRKIYRTLTVTQWRFLDHLPSIFVLEEIYGVPDWNNVEQYKIWGNIKTLEVMDYLLSKSYIRIELRGVGSCLEEAASEGRIEMIRPLLEMGDQLLVDCIGDELYTFDALIAALIGGHIDIVRLLDDRQHCGDQQLESMLESVLQEGGNEDSIRYVFEHHLDLARDDLDITMEIIISMDCVVALKIAVEMYGSRIDLESHVFKTALEEGRSNIVGYLLETINPVPDLDSTLRTIASIRSDEKRREITRALARSRYIKVEEMDIPTFRSFYKLLGRATEDREAVRQIEKKNSICSLLLRFILIKQPTDIELTDWITERNDKHLQLPTYTTQRIDHTLLLCLRDLNLEDNELLNNLLADRAREPS